MVSITISVHGTRELSIVPEKALELAVAALGLDFLDSAFELICVEVFERALRDLGLRYDGRGNILRIEF